MVPNQVLKPKLCVSCQKEYQPKGPSSMYCPECKVERKKQQDRERMAAKGNGKARPKAPSGGGIVEVKVPYKAVDVVKLHCVRCPWKGQMIAAIEAGILKVSL